MTSVIQECDDMSFVGIEIKSHDIRIDSIALGDLHIDSYFLWHRKLDHPLFHTPLKVLGYNDISIKSLNTRFIFYFVFMIIIKLPRFINFHSWHLM